MNEYDEILGTESKKTKSYNNYSKYKNNNYSNNKNNWREQQNKDRQDIYNSMDRMATIVSGDIKKFQQYLDIQTRFSKHSVGNCLVILEKAPNSTQIKDKNSWKEKGFDLIEKPKAIKILEPNNSNGRIFYNPKEVYDITQTNAPQEDKEINYDSRKLLEAILSDCDVPRKAVDKLPDGRIGALYSKDENVLFVCKGMEKDLLFRTLFQEIANIEMREEKDSNIKDFRSYCVSYMMCKRYGIDVSDYEFDRLPAEITTKNKPKDIRYELDQIRGNFESINSRMADYFEKGNKEKNKSVPER